MAASNAAAATETRDVEDFVEISFTMPFDVEFVLSDKPYVRLDGDEDTIEEIITENRGDTLHIRKKDSWFDWNDEEVVVTVGYRTLERISMSGSGDGYAQEINSDNLNLAISGSATLEIETLATGNLDISITGSGDVEIHTLKADAITTKIAGSGNVDLAGRADKQKISIAGSGNYSASKLKTSETDAKISGSGDIQIWVESRLSATVMGSGDIEYYGKPSLNERTMGSGDITRVGDAP
jgi:hypothetical protein